MSSLFYLWLRGVAMGAADAVPGVSGGTVAFITGIYETLINSIRSITPQALGILFKQGPVAFWQHINGTFLLVLLFGIVCSLATVARLVLYLLATHPVLIWAFFFGLILSSAVWMVRQVRSWHSQNLVSAMAAAVLAFTLTSFTPMQAEVTPVALFIAGAIAICAMILPGISGSFILLLMGMYTPVMMAVKGFDIVNLGFFVAGCCVGLLSFSHLLGWMFKHHHDLTVAVLTGFMIGSLNKIWPWKYTLSYRVDSHGEQVPLQQGNLWPWDYTAVTGSASQLLLALVLMGVAGLMIYLVELKLKKTEAE